jgi:hypothetical protein
MEAEDATATMMCVPAGLRVWWWMSVVDRWTIWMLRLLVWIIGARVHMRARVDGCLRVNVRWVVLWNAMRFVARVADRSCWRLRRARAAVMTAVWAGATERFLLASPVLGEGADDGSTDGPEEAMTALMANVAARGTAP